MSVETTVQTGAAYRVAEQLADAIRNMPEWEEWESARAAARTDESFQALAGRHRAIIEGAGPDASPSDLDAKTRAELDAVRGEIDAHPVAVRQQEAVMGVLDLLRRVNHSLSLALGVDFARSAAPPREGCSSGCCG
ncbi:MAG: YlbF family regulator [Vicinamibacteraceae bacterium]|nr:YlbF family regulator [Vicinamibacteraceae bacterium]